MLYASDFRKIARDALSGKWALAVGTGFVASLLGAITYGGGSSGRNSNNNDYNMINSFAGPFYGFFQAIAFIAVIIIIWAIIAFIVGGAAELGYCKFNMKLIKGNDPKFNDLFSHFDLIGKALGLRIVIGIFIFLWTLLLVIPGIIATYRYSMAFYIMEERPSMGILDAISESKELMIGNKFRFFCLQISFIGWAILCIFTLGIGLLWLIPYMQASFAAFYLEISGKLNSEESAYDTEYSTSWDE